MNIGVGLLVFFVSLIALIAELVLYFVFGVGSSLAGSGVSSISGIAFFFVGLMLLTGVTGISFPCCCVIASISKNNKLGRNIFLILLAVIFIFYFAIFPITNRTQNKIAAVSPRLVSGLPTQQVQQVKRDNIAQEYIKNKLTLSNVGVTQGYGQFDVPGYSESKKAAKGTVKNIGDRSISLVEITIYFLDTNSNRVGEKSFTIVNTENIFEKTPSLKPNYSKDFGYIVEKDAPSDWTGKVEVEISKIKFDESANNQSVTQPS